jgi:phosphonopyruvate decarboxylase
MTKPDTLDRRDVLSSLIPDPGSYLFVSGLAGASRDTAALTNDGGNLFALGGVMGAAVSIGLGMALGAPERRVMVVTGDGELFMNIGALASVASAEAANLSIVCLDNSRHGETGNQTGHSGRHADIALVGRGAGLPSTLTVTRREELAGAHDFLETAPGPRLVVVKVADGPPTAFSRLMDPVARRLRFRNAFLAGTGAA